MSWTPIEAYAEDEQLADELCEATGFNDPSAGALLVEQLANAHPDAPRTDPGCSPEIPTVAANKTRLLLAEVAGDGLQGLLAAQLVGAHNLTMSVLRAVRDADFDPEHPGIRIVERLMRLNARQAEVLGNLRRGGEQVVTVRREQITIERHDDGSETTDRRTVEARGAQG